MKHRLVASFLLCLVFLVACNDDSSQRDTGPNAGLNNHDLLTKAIANMKALKSYHFELNGAYPTISTEMNLAINMVGDMQTDEKGSRIKATGDSNTNDTTSTPGKADNGSVDVILVKGSWYESYDSDKTWSKIRIDTPAYLMIGSIGLLWDTRFSFGYPTPGEQVMNGLDIKQDGSAIESLDGIATRRISAEPNGSIDIGAPALILTVAKSCNIWISTDVAPTIHQMVVSGQKDGKLYNLTWKWSRFNEDFGIVNPPPEEKINTPIP